MRLIGVATQFRLGEGVPRARFWGVLEPYLEALSSQGLAHVLLPPQPREALERILSHLDGLLLPGGGDLDPALYGEEPHPSLGEVSPERDDHELFLARYAAERGLPTLGVCRGLQVMNVALGGTLYQDLEAQGLKGVQHYQKSPPPALAHTLQQVEQSPLSNLFPEGFRVNSYHHQGVKTLGRGLRPLAVAPDGLVEAVALEGHPLFLGVQWHPELLRGHHPLFGLLRA
ncbi:gamma-glutamyl-gamma-aminobutyrate hydrolase family protein [Meiothermus sp. QL-1]|uniref:gamma-glutamyl-gamma-aminobutyrate hydrolase family protein n=1 Tax=Meiothermus sp. QL-1 TaxID=2058095 RepID=UPI000E0C31AB|nr:gamma-glutamyl-gamma-aminobutyrate hydrolase family protein [Meiothermus sp. QL-1]RDI95003.1 gamma-glutamyl-gamma-aminobutyrate hydrolase family protein [Meiothermus sp. QL-1]